MARISLPLTFGQSYAAQGYGNRWSAYAFAVAMRRAIATDAAAITSRLGVTVSAADLTQLHQVAVNGSAIRQANADGNDWWVNNDGSASALLNSVVAAMAGYGARPRIAVWSHGERDAQYVADAAAVALVKSAVTNRLFPDIRAAMIPGNPTGARIWVDMLGFRIVGDEDRENMLRDMIVEIITETQGVFRGAEKYAAELDATLHPTQAGYQMLGAHTGRRVAHFLVTGNQLEAPTISGASRSGNTVTVNIAVPSGGTLVKPAHPGHFGLYNAGGAKMPYSAMWAGDTLTLTTPNQAVSLRYPARENNFDASRIIRLADPNDPIYPGEPGLPLQSRLPIVF